MWVQLRSMQYVTENGKQVAKYPGDWVDVGRQIANLWISRGEAHIPGGQIERVHGDGVGIVVDGSLDAAYKTLEIFGDSLNVQASSPALLFEHSMIWNTGLQIRSEMIATGFSFLDTWEIAVPLWNYQQLAITAGDKDERDLTEKIIRDLRVPVYDTRLMFVKRSQTTTELFDLWRKDVRDGRDERLSFLRAIYNVKPFILALPTTWTDHNAPR